MDAFQINVLGLFMTFEEIGLKTELRILVDFLWVGDSPFSPLSRLKLKNKKLSVFGSSVRFLLNSKGGNMKTS